MKTTHFQVRTRAGRVFNVRFIVTNHYNMRNNRDARCEIEIDGKWYSCFATLARSKNGSYVPAVRICNTEAMQALSVPDAMRKDDICIEAESDWRPLYKTFLEDHESTLKESAKSIRFTKLIASYHTSLGWMFSAEIESGDKSLLDFNEEYISACNIIRAFDRNMKGELAEYITGEDYDDYSITTRHEFTREQVAALKARADEIIAGKKAKIEADKKAIQDKFDEAKRTGKPVVLSQIFLTGDDIPKQFRDDDSDMGHLIQYAMPDGSTTEEFLHAY